MGASQGHCWLENPNSTCYLNAVLQTLFMTKEFRQHVLNMSVPSGDNFIKELKKLFIELEKQQETAVSAAEVTKSLGITDVAEQADAAQHLHLIIKKTGSSELFKGTEKTTRTCRECSGKHESFEDFLSFSVSLEEYQDVEDALKPHAVQLGGQNKPSCSHCKCNTDLKTERKIINFPKILIIQGYKKNDLKGNIRHHIKAPSDDEYDLYTIINHYDTAKGGHYYADIKCEDKFWYRFNDKSVSKIDMNESPTFRSSDAYLLVYRHRDTQTRCMLM